MRRSGLTFEHYQNALSCLTMKQMREALEHWGERPTGRFKTDLKEKCLAALEKKNGFGELIYAIAYPHGPVEGQEAVKREQKKSLKTLSCFSSTDSEMDIPQVPVAEPEAVKRGRKKIRTDLMANPVPEQSKLPLQHAGLEAKKRGRKKSKTELPRPMMASLVPKLPQESPVPVVAPEAKKRGRRKKAELSQSVQGLPQKPTLSDTIEKALKRGPKKPSSIVVQSVLGNPGPEPKKRGRKKSKTEFPRPTMANLVPKLPQEPPAPIAEPEAVKRGRKRIRTDLMANQPQPVMANPVSELSKLPLLDAGPEIKKRSSKKSKTQLPRPMMANLVPKLPQESPVPVVAPEAKKRGRRKKAELSQPVQGLPQQPTLSDAIPKALKRVPKKPSSLVLQSVSVNPGPELLQEPPPLPVAENKVMKRIQNKPKQELKLCHPLVVDIMWPQMFHEVRKILIPPTILGPVIPGKETQVYKCVLQLSQEDQDAICRSQMAIQASENLNQQRQNPDLGTSVCIRFCATSTYVDQTDLYPPDLHVRINEREIILNRNMLKSARRQFSSPLFVTEYINYFRTCLANPLTIEWKLPTLKEIQASHTENLEKPGGTYTMTAYLCERLTIPMLIAKIKKNPVISKLETIKVIKRINGRSNKELNATERMKVSLLCPITKRRISIPCRGTKCTHFTCFDVQNFLQINEVNLNLRVKLRCPLCINPLKVEDIRVDKYYTDLLEEFDGVDISDVEVDDNGLWIKPKVQVLI